MANNSLETEEEVFSSEEDQGNIYEHIAQAQPTFPPLGTFSARTGRLLHIGPPLNRFREPIGERQPHSVPYLSPPDIPPTLPSLQNPPPAPIRNLLQTAGQPRARPSPPSQPSLGNFPPTHHPPLRQTSTQPRVGSSPGRSALRIFAPTCRPPLKQSSTQPEDSQESTVNEHPLPSDPPIGFFRQSKCQPLCRGARQTRAYAWATQSKASRPSKARSLAARDPDVPIASIEARTSEETLVKVEQSSSGVLRLEDITIKYCSSRSPPKRPRKMPYNNSAIPPPDEISGQATLPLARVKKILQTDEDNHRVSNNAAFVITIATELFIRHLAEQALNVAKLDKKPRRNIQYKDLANAVARIDNLQFLEDVIPRTTTYREYKAKRASKATAPGPNSLQNGQTTLDGSRPLPQRPIQAADPQRSALDDGNMSDGTIDEPPVAQPRQESTRVNGHSGLVFEHYEPNGTSRREESGDVEMK